MRVRPWCLAGVIAIVMTLAAVEGAAADDRELCKTAKGDEAIAACTRAIESKKYKHKKFRRTLSLLYTNRGVEYEIKKEFDRAIADHSEAIKVDPKNWAAYNNRGNAHAGKREYSSAITDYDTAVKLNEKYAQAFYNRGLAKRNSGDSTGAEGDIAQARLLQPGIGETAN